MAPPFGILLAGGKGERLGLRLPKAIVVLDGETLLARALATLSKACGDVAVVAPPEVDLPLPAGVSRILDDGSGPLGGLAIAAATVSSDRVLVLGVDFPLVRVAALSALAEDLGAASGLVPAPGGRPQPLVAAYSREGLASLAQAYQRGERSIVRALEALRPRFLDDRAIEALPGGAENFLDVDTASDLAECERRLRVAAGRA